MSSKSGLSSIILFLTVLGLTGFSALLTFGDETVSGKPAASAGKTNPVADSRPLSPPPNGEASRSGEPSRRGPDDRRDGPPPGPGGPPGGPDDRPGPPDGEGPPNRPGSFGPGQPFGDRFHGPRGDGLEMLRSDPEISNFIKLENELDQQTREVIRSYREAPEKQRAEIKEDLKKVVTKQFETRLQHRRLELTRFEEELKRLRNATDTREKEKQPIIEKRVSDLLRDETPGQNPKSKQK